MVTMSSEELKRLGIIKKTMDDLITRKAAGELIGLSVRQVIRLVKRMEKEGDRGIIHRSRGGESNRRISEKTRRKVLRRYRKEYWDFGPTFATEKLRERDGIRISDETLRLWLIEAGIWEAGRKARVHRQWRERKACFGQMVQVDGSHHDWLEKRGPKLVLMGYIDDATGRAYGRFYEYEGTMPALDSFIRYTKLNGLVQSVYVDRHTTYKSPKENLWEDKKTLSKFEEALERVGVRAIHAMSPQAKGRIERLFRTLQDRLVKEMRLAKVKTKDEANEFLEEYLPKFNERFEKEPKSPVNLHREVPAGMVLERELSIQDSRVLRNDNTVQYEGKFYQIQKGWSRRPEGVVMERWVDGSLHIRDGVHELAYQAIEPPAKKESAVKVKGYLRMARRPTRDHPWRKVPRAQRAFWAKKDDPGQNPTSLNTFGEEILARQGLGSRPDLTLSTYSQNSQRERKKEPKKERERTATFFLLQKQQNQKGDISILAK